MRAGRLRGSISLAFGPSDQTFVAIRSETARFFGSKNRSVFISFIELGKLRPNLTE